MTTLSIIIPAYNMAPYIRSAVQSALDQTIRDLQVIVVNDGSTDGTDVILRSIQDEKRDGRLLIIHQTNRGLAAARNAGVRAAIGRYIGFLDGDDIWDLTKAEKHIALMGKDATIGITFSHSRCIAEDGRHIGVLTARKSELTLHDLIRRNYIGNGSALIARRDCFDIAGLFNEHMAGRGVEDYEMWCRILHDTNFRAVLVPEPLTHYRLRDRSMSTNLAPYMQNADDAMKSLRSKMPEVPHRVFIEGHAEHYRHAAWKAAEANHRITALRYLMKALRRCPWLFYHDWRSLATIAAILLPKATWIKLLRYMRARRAPAQIRT